MKDDLTFPPSLSNCNCFSDGFFLFLLNLIIHSGWSLKFIKDDLTFPISLSNYTHAFFKKAKGIL